MGKYINKENLNFSFLGNLISTPSPSGYEDKARKVFEDYVKDFAEVGEPDKIENGYCRVGSKDNNAPCIMLSAHIDEIALQVQNIDKEGFIHFVCDGGVDRKAILASNVTILHDGNYINGVIGKKPIHIEHKDGEAYNKATELKDMKIDIGCNSNEEASKYVSVGDPIVIRGKQSIVNLYNDRIAASGIDDKIGVFVVAETIKVLSVIGLKNISVYGVACTQEETTGSGAVSAAKQIEPDFSIDYDVTFATDDKYVDENEWGDVKLGKGGAIAYGVDCNNKFAKFVKNTVKDIPYQEFSLDCGGTNTRKIKQSSFDCHTLLMSIPERNMHTQVEVCDMNDIISLIDMTVETILKIDENNGVI